MKDFKEQLRKEGSPLLNNWLQVTPLQADAQVIFMTELDETQLIADLRQLLFQRALNPNCYCLSLW